MGAQEEGGNPLAIRRRRLRYRASHRGIQEMDIVLGGYVDALAESLSEGQIERIERLLDESDSDLLAWITGQIDTPADVDRELISEISAFQAGRFKKQ